MSRWRSKSSANAVRSPPRADSTSAGSVGTFAFIPPIVASVGIRVTPTSGRIRTEGGWTETKATFTGPTSTRQERRDARGERVRALPTSSPAWDLTEMIGMEATEPLQIHPGGGALTTVRDIMSTELVTVEPSANLTEAVHAMSAGRSGSVLVLKSGSLVGIFTERDILRALAHSAKADLARISSVTQWMSRDPVTIGPDTTV